jgi:hypothetical protein
VTDASLTLRFSSYKSDIKQHLSAKTRMTWGNALFDKRREPAGAHAGRPSLVLHSGAKRLVQVDRPLVQMGNLRTVKA